MLSENHIYLETLSGMNVLVQGDENSDIWKMGGHINKRESPDLGMVQVEFAEIVLEIIGHNFFLKKYFFKILNFSKRSHQGLYNGTSPSV